MAVVYSDFVFMPPPVQTDRRQIVFYLSVRRFVRLLTKLLVTIFCKRLILMQIRTDGPHVARA